MKAPGSNDQAPGQDLGVDTLLALLNGNTLDEVRQVGAQLIAAMDNAAQTASEVQAGSRQQIVQALAEMAAEEEPEPDTVPGLEALRSLLDPDNSSRSRGNPRRLGLTALGSADSAPRDIQDFVRMKATEVALRPVREEHRQQAHDTLTAFWGESIKEKGYGPFKEKTGHSPLWFFKSEGLGGNYQTPYVTVAPGLELAIRHVEENNDSGAGFQLIVKAEDARGAHIHGSTFRVSSDNLRHKGLVYATILKNGRTITHAHEAINGDVLRAEAADREVIKLLQMTMTALDELLDNPPEGFNVEEQVKIK